jgi:hypothetical protein
MEGQSHLAMITAPYLFARLVISFPASLVTGRRPMVKLYNAATNQPLGDIPDDQLQFLIDQFEEEWEGDQDYYINTATIDMLKDAGADPSLLALLQRALGAAGEAEIRWSSE